MKEKSTDLVTVAAGYHTVTPWIITRDSDALSEFLAHIFGAEELARILNDDGSIGHIELRIGDSVVMGFDMKPEWPHIPAFFRLFVDDADATHRRAREAGATWMTEVTPLFWGDRVGRVRDPFGNVWWITERVEEVTPDEMAQRAQEPAWIERMAHLQRSLVVQTDQPRNH